jgi:hypothetical protein
MHSILSAPLGEFAIIISRQMQKDWYFGKSINLSKVMQIGSTKIRIQSQDSNTDLDPGVSSQGSSQR